MERTKNVVVENVERAKVKYKKIGGGSLRLGGKIIKPGETFKAYPEDIPVSFRDLVIPVEGGSVSWEKPATPPPPIVFTKPVFELKPRGKSKSQYDVVDGQGKAINEKPLTKAIGEKLIEDLLK
jgi:hypothetical protein